VESWVVGVEGTNTTIFTGYFTLGLVLEKRQTPVANIDQKREHKKGSNRSEEHFVVWQGFKLCRNSESDEYFTSKVL
jgi:hypothetical protein